LDAIDGGYGNFPTIGDVEPPDGGTCAGNGYVIDFLNLGEMAVYSGTSLNRASADVTMDSLMGLTSLGWSSGGDTSCLYDYDNGGHWFFSEIVSTTSEAVGGAFVGCFAGVIDSCREGIAVSVSNNPLGAYNVFFINPNLVNPLDPGAGYLFMDFAKMANTRDAFLFFYDEFNFRPPVTYPTCPAYGCYGFNGAQEFAFSKKALEVGYSVSSPYFVAAEENMGLDPKIQPTSGFGLPDGNCETGLEAGLVCWYAQIPAESPDPTQFENTYGGVGWMAGTLDFFSLGDNRVAVWYWEGLSCLNSFNGDSCATAPTPLGFGGYIVGTSCPGPGPCLNVPLGNYLDEGAACYATLGGVCGIAQQETGPVPLGYHCNLITATLTAPCAEFGIASNGDFATQVSFADGLIWFAIPTLITQTTPAQIHIGADYFVLQATPSFSFKMQGYFTAKGEDIVFPSIGGTNDGKTAVATFTLTGPNYYPSSAYGTLSTTGTGTLQSGKTMNIADLGMSPQDGFTEYLKPLRPRWGDYNWAVYVPSAGGVYFESEYIQSPNCSNSQFLIDPSCGGTRDPYANWGSSENFVPVP
jgi:hypothetical protein